MLQISQLKAGYGGKTVIDIPEFSLADGEHCLITGMSGTGKTTLLYALAGLLTPTAGSIKIEGVELSNLQGAPLDCFRGKHIGIIYQTLHMVGALTVLENLLLPNYAAGLPQDAAKAQSLLVSLGLSELAQRKPSELSQGQQQRVAIARAAMNSPQLLLGDEPTSALDDRACEAVMELLLTTAKACNASLVVATHDSRIKKYFTRFVELEGVI